MTIFHFSCFGFRPALPCIFHWPPWQESRKNWAGGGHPEVCLGNWEMKIQLCRSRGWGRCYLSLMVCWAHGKPNEPVVCQDIWFIAVINFWMVGHPCSSPDWQPLLQGSPTGLWDDSMRACHISWQVDGVCPRKAAASCTCIHLTLIKLIQKSIPGNSGLHWEIIIRPVSSRHLFRWFHQLVSRCVAKVNITTVYQTRKALRNEEKNALHEDLNELSTQISSNNLLNTLVFCCWAFLYFINTLIHIQPCSLTFCLWCYHQTALN